MSTPKQIGEVMQELFILREDGTVDLDMLAALLHAEELHGFYRTRIITN